MLEKPEQHLIQNNRYFNILSIEDQIRFAKNLVAAGKYKSVNDYCRKNYFLNFTDFIVEAFNWHTSKEGTAYWFNRSTLDVDDTATKKDDTIVQQQLRDLTEENQQLKLKLEQYQQELDTCRKDPVHTVAPNSWNYVKREHLKQVPYKSSLLTGGVDAIFKYLEDNYYPPLPHSDTRHEIN